MLHIENIEVSILPLIPEAKIPPKKIDKEDSVTTQKSQVALHKEDEPVKRVPIPIPVREETLYKEEVEPDPPLPIKTERRSDPVTDALPLPLPIKEEPVYKKELEPETSSAAQAAAKNIHIEKPEPLVQHRKEEKTLKKAVAMTEAVPSASRMDSAPKKEENPPSLKVAPLQAMRRDIPIEGSKPYPQQVEEKVAKEPAVTASNLALPQETGSTFEKVETLSFLRDSPSKGEDQNPPVPLLHSGRSKEKPPLDITPSEKSNDVVKYSPSSDGNIAFSQPRYAENPKPVYPKEARRKGYEGEVLLKVEVLANGRVGRVDVKKSSGYEILDRSALTAVKQWKFIPANEGDGSIPCWVNIPIKFQLQ